MEKILITGASGFIGSALVERALAEGMDVWAALRPTSSRRYLKDDRIHLLRLDLTDDAALSAALRDHVAEHGPFDYVIHAAGATQCRREADYFEVNTRGTARLALALRLTGAMRREARFVFMSSLSVCGPLHEADGRPLAADERPAPDTAYGRSKLQAEEFLADVKELDFVVLRPTGVYGPRERDYLMLARSIRRHVDFRVGLRPQRLTFIHVADLVEATFLALRRGRSRAVYHLTDGAEYTSRAFSDLLQAELGVRGVLHVCAPLWLLRVVCLVVGWGARLLGRSATLNPDKYRIMRQRNWTASIEPARRDLGFDPQYPLPRGVRETVAWYRRAGWL